MRREGDRRITKENGGKEKRSEGSRGVTEEKRREEKRKGKKMMGQIDK